MDGLLGQRAPSTEPDLLCMLKDFRVHELQSLLGFAHRNKNGKKAELLHRATELLRHSRSLPVQLKVREMYRHIQSEMGSRNGSGYVMNPSQVAGAAANYFCANQMVPMGLPTVPADPFAVAQPPQPHVSVPLNPSVQLVRLPFFDHIAELLKPTTLIPRSPQRFQENAFTFALDADQVKLIDFKREYLLPRYEVQLRFCQLDPSRLVKDDFPPAVVVRVNNHMVQLPLPIPSNKPGVEPKRPSRPVDITSHCSESHSKLQRVHISWGAEEGKHWVVSVSLVRHVNSTILLTRLKQRGFQAAEKTKALIKEKLADSNDADIATTSLRVSLLCPLGKMRIGLPSKTSACGHVQCFDANLFLMMNEKKPTWQCPVCDQDGHFDHLLLDGYVSNVLANCDPDIQDIEVHDDGSWSPLVRDDDNLTQRLQHQPRHQVPSTSAAPAPAQSGTAGASAAGQLNRTISLDDSGLSNSTTKSVGSQQQEEVLIDLVSSDEEGELPDSDAARLSAPRSLSHSQLQRHNELDMHSPPLLMPVSATSGAAAAGSPLSVILLESPQTARSTPDEPLATTTAPAMGASLPVSLAASSPTSTVSHSSKRLLSPSASPVVGVVAPKRVCQVAPAAAVAPMRALPSPSFSPPLSMASRLSHSASSSLQSACSGSIPAGSMPASSVAAAPSSYYMQHFHSSQQLVPGSAGVGGHYLAPGPPSAYSNSTLQYAAAAAHYSAAAAATLSAAAYSQQRQQQQSTAAFYQQPHGRPQHANRPPPLHFGPRHLISPAMGGAAAPSPSSSQYGELQHFPFFQQQQPLYTSVLATAPSSLGRSQAATPLSASSVSPAPFEFDPDVSALELRVHNNLQQFLMECCAEPSVAHGNQQQPFH